jgi:hypothetical protein
MKKHSLQALPTIIISETPPSGFESTKELA